MQVNANWLMFGHEHGGLVWDDCILYERTLGMICVCLRFMIAVVLFCEGELRRVVMSITGISNIYVHITCRRA